MGDLKLKKREDPVLYQKKEECCGCGACYSVCPKNAITMKADKEGFLYPRIDKNICVKCYKCVSVCIFKKDQNSRIIESEM